MGSISLKGGSLRGYQPYKGIGADEKALMPMVMLNPFVMLM